MNFKSETRKALLLWSALLCSIVFIFWVTVFVLNSSLYSPNRLIAKYFVSLSAGDLPKALGILNATVPQGDASLLTQEAVERAVGKIENIKIVDIEKTGNNMFLATVSASLGGQETVSQFSLKRNENFFFLFHDWSFASRPLPVLNVSITNGNVAEINGSLVGLPNGSAVFPVMYPSLYNVSFKDDFFEADPQQVQVLGGFAGNDVRVVLEKKINSSLQTSLESQLKEFLDNCVESTVLAPTGCPFYYATDNRIFGQPNWEVLNYPTVSVKSFGGSWAVANLEGKVRVSGRETNIFTGQLDEFSKDIVFSMEAKLDFSGEEVKLVPNVKY